MKNCADPNNIFGQGGLIKELTKAIIEKALSAEMDKYLGYRAVMNELRIYNSHKRSLIRVSHIFCF